MNTDEKLDRLSDTIAFLLARMNGDPDGAMAIVDNDAHKITELLIGMTDLATAMAMTLGMMTRTNPRSLVQRMAMGIKYEGKEMVEKFMRGGE